MKRLDKSSDDLAVNQKLQVFVELVSRFNLANKLGMQYDGDRDVYQALGYQETISFEDYWKRYRRQDMAKAVIKRPAKATWQGPLKVVVPDNPDSDLEKAWNDLEKKLGLKNRFLQLDQLTAIGEYGVLFMGLNGTPNSDGFARRVSSNGKKKLVYVRAYSQGSVDIKTYEKRADNERYGLPVLYHLKGTDAETQKSVAIDIHYSRIIHTVGDDALESDVKGSPRMEAVYNRLMDLEKVVGGSSEMYWRGARPGYQGLVDEDYTLTEPMKEDLKNQLNEFEHNMRRFFMNEGVTLEALKQQLEDPKNFVDVVVQMISAETGIPKRILMGSERGELSSGQDRTEWLNYVKTRREEYAEPQIVRPFVDRCMEYGILPVNENYEIQWENVFAPSEKDKVDIGEGRARSLKEYSQNPMAEVILPPDQFLSKVLGFTDEEIEEIKNERDKAILEEIKELRESLTGGGELPEGQPGAPGGAGPPQLRRQPQPVEEE